MTPGNTHMESGKKYLIRYQGPSGRTEYELVARFLFFSRPMNLHSFDLRPVAGTVNLRRDEITFIEEVSATTKISAPKRVRK